VNGDAKYEGKEAIDKTFKRKESRRVKNHQVRLDRTNESADGLRSARTKAKH